MKSLAEQMGERVRYYRNAKGMRLVDLAAATNITPGYLSSIENGKTNTSLAILEAISEALGVPPSLLLGREEAQNKADMLERLCGILPGLSESSLDALLRIAAGLYKIPADKS